MLVTITKNIYIYKYVKSSLTEEYMSYTSLKKMLKLYKSQHYLLFKN